MIIAQLLQLLLVLVCHFVHLLSQVSLALTHLGLELLFQF